MRNNNLGIRDLVTTGVFGAVYFILMFSVGMIGVVPVLFMIYPAVLGIVSGPLLMLFTAKEPKPWTLFILGMLSPVIMFFMGHTFLVPLHAIFVMLLSEAIRRAGNYKNKTFNMISIGVFSTWICGSLMQMLLLKERYKEMSSVMGLDYVNALERLVTPLNMTMVYAGAFAGGLLGAWAGIKLLGRHFEKAGIV